MIIESLKNMCSFGIVSIKGFRWLPLATEAKTSGFYHIGMKHEEVFVPLPILETRPIHASQTKISISLIIGDIRPNVRVHLK